jgi:hypothetical protein
MRGRPQPRAHARGYSLPALRAWRGELPMGNFDREIFSRWFVFERLRVFRAGFPANLDSTDRKVRAIQIRFVRRRPMEASANLDSTDRKVARGLGSVVAKPHASPNGPLASRGMGLGNNLFRSLTRGGWISQRCNAVGGFPGPAIPIIGRRGLGRRLRVLRGGVRRRRRESGPRRFAPGRGSPRLPQRMSHVRAAFRGV